MLENLNKIIKNHNQDKWFIAIVGLVGTVVLCVLDFWVFAMLFAFVTSMYVIALHFKLV